MMQVFSPAELLAKGITRRDIQRMLKRSESRVSAYVKTYTRNGRKCSPDFQQKWGAECARWDHLRATLAAFE